MRPRVLTAALAGFVLCLHGAAAQTQVDSTFVGLSSSHYSDANNWAPTVVPNNTETTSYNIEISEKYVFVDIDATVSNLTLESASTRLSVSTRTFTVTETTLTTRPNVFVASNGPEPSTFNAGTLTAFSDGALTGDYDLLSYDAAGPATLQFRGAHVVALRDARLFLTGVASRVVDENGNDALRNLAEIDAASSLALDGANLTTVSPLQVDGTLMLGGYFQTPATFTASASLTNFDPSTRTFSGGTFVLKPYFSPPDAGPVELRFAGADIVNNGSSITLANDTSRITDLNGLDGLRNLARNLPGSRLSLFNRAFVTLGDFTNDGALILDESSFFITGTLTNFDPATRIINGGDYGLIGELRFRGADIVHNAAAILIERQGRIVDEVGNDGLRNFSDNLASGSFTVGDDRHFVAPGDFSNAGKLTTSSGYPGFPGTTGPGTFTLPAGSAYTQSAGSTINNGTFTASLVDILAGTLSGAGTIWGDVRISDATVVPGGVIQGGLTLSPASRTSCALGEYRVITAWTNITGQVALAGTLEVEIKAENYLGNGEVLTILQSDEPLTGNFSNAPDGTRIASADGSGSFLVRYDAHTVTLTGFQANPPTAQLLNISTRGYLRAGDDVYGNEYLIAGFIITGSEPKTVILRGLGPSLTQHGIGEPVNDPKLELHPTGNQGSIVTNNDWRDTQQAEIEASGLAPQDPRESAIKVTLGPGTYTVVLQETNGLPGNGLVEVYDLSPSVTSKLANISTRGFIEPGGVLIGGIIAGGAGQANAEIVVRAIGPHLRRTSAVFTALEDPTLEMRDANGEIVAFDEALPVPRVLVPYFAGEHAVHVSLPRGQYTALVRSKSGSPGTALVEFYDLRH
jgi:hypothetical protein